MRLILEVDVQLLENGFVNGYGKGDRVFYESPFDIVGDTKDNSDTYIKGENC